MHRDSLCGLRWGQLRAVDLQAVAAGYRLVQVGIANELEEALW
jgi:hypothetical protein